MKHTNFGVGLHSWPQDENLISEMLGPSTDMKGGLINWSWAWVYFHILYIQKTYIRKVLTGITVDTIPQVFRKCFLELCNQLAGSDEESGRSLLGGGFFNTLPKFNIAPEKLPSQ